eukprot:TRINITY_DN984_c0_g1_i2.p1 TRINITY_DN984_c0_g1~~TRINITY_DN984_c0_g1_i2.p1  ORF type:complete len:459 (+),score=57.65 TRINITY_DN984_c0_g1_i2:53-1429(+)
MPLPQDIQQKTFQFMGVLALGAVTYVVLYGNFLMIEPHLKTLFFAFSWGLILSRAKRPTMYSLKAIGSIQRKVKIVVQVSILVTYFAFAFALIRRVVLATNDTLSTRFLHVVVLITVLCLLLAPMLLDTDTFATLLLMITFGSMVLFVLFIVAKKCVDETAIATNAVIDFSSSLQQSVPASAKEFWDLLEDRCQQLHHLDAQLFGFEFHPAESCVKHALWLQENLPQLFDVAFDYLKANIGVFGDNLRQLFKASVDFASGLTDFAFSSFLFISTLFYFVKYDSVLGAELLAMSPLERDDSDWMYRMIYDKIVSAFGLVIGMALLNFVVTIFSFWYIGSEVIWVFGFVSGFLAVIPIFSSWLVWIPAAVVLVARDGVFSMPWVVMVSLHMIAYVLSTFIPDLSGLKSQRPEIIGMSIVLGIYVYGAWGVLFGPILSGALLALKQFYTETMFPERRPYEI